MSFMFPVRFVNPQISAMASLPQDPATLFYNASATCVFKKEGPVSYYQEIDWKTRKIEPITFDAEGPAADMVRGKTVRIEAAVRGINGAPILYNEATNKPIAIFKGHNDWTTTNHGDILAYSLDHDSYAKVPAAFNVTSLPSAFPEKGKFLGGTFVAWVPNSREITNGELLGGDIEQRQAIAILDIRLGNQDRSIFNIIVDEEGNLIPIDHDNILTSYSRYSTQKLRACYSLETFTPRAKHYIENLDIQKDVAIARKLKVSENEIANLVIRTAFLKLAVEADIAVGRLEDLIERIYLPTGVVGEFCENWLFSHNLRKILSKIPEPYHGENLKNALRVSFEIMLHTTEYMDDWGRLDIIKGPLKAMLFAKCWLWGPTRAQSGEIGT